MKLHPPARPRECMGWRVGVVECDLRGEGVGEGMGRGVTDPKPAIYFLPPWL